MVKHSSSLTDPASQFSLSSIFPYTSLFYPTRIVTNLQRMAINPGRIETILHRIATILHRIERILHRIARIL
jgi:hypothetical protein